MSKQRYPSIDCIKGLACIAVVIIHYNISGGSIPPEIGLAMKTVCRFAVLILSLAVSECVFWAKQHAAGKAGK